MRPTCFPPRSNRHAGRAVLALAVLAAVLAAPTARAQSGDQGLAQLQQQLQPIAGAQLQPQLLSPADAAPQPAVQQVQAAPQPLPTVAAPVQPPAMPQPVVAPQAVAQQDVALPQPAAVVAQAAEVQPAPPAPVATQPEPAAPQRVPVRHVSEIGPTSEAWLELQRSNRAASPDPHPFEGAAASYAYQRYLNSFSQPIPNWFTSVQQGSGSGGSSFGSGGSQSN